MSNTVPARVGPKSSTIVCSHCHAQIKTTVKYTTRNKAHIWAFILCICGCIPCCLIPYCMDSCKNSVHNCPNCDAYLGTYEPDN